VGAALHTDPSAILLTDLGIALTSRLFELESVRHTERRRGVEVPDEGKRELSERLDI
jgi:hypothetical protein